MPLYILKDYIYYKNFVFLGDKKRKVYKRDCKKAPKSRQTKPFDYVESSISIILEIQ